MGWGVTVNMGYAFTHSPVDSHPWRHGFLEATYQKLYSRFWNVTVPDPFAYGQMGDNAVGDLAGGGVVGGDGDGWRRAEAAERARIERGARRGAPVRH